LLWVVDHTLAASLETGLRGFLLKVEDIKCCYRRLWNGKSSFSPKEA